MKPRGVDPVDEKRETVSTTMNPVDNAHFDADVAAAIKKVRIEYCTS